MVVVVGVMDRGMATCVLVSGGGCWCYGETWRLVCSLVVVVVGVMDRGMATCVLVSGGGCWCYGETWRLVC